MDKTQKITQRKKNSKYWKSRAIKMEDDSQKKAEKLSKLTKREYIRSLSRINQKVDGLYAELLNMNWETLTRTDLYRLNHWNSLRRTIEEEITGLATSQTNRLTDLLIDVASEAFGLNIQTFGREFNLIDEMSIRGIVDQDWSGIKYSERIWRNANAFNSRVLNDIESIVVEGKNPQTVKRALRKDFGVSFNEADRLIRTETSRAFNSAALESYKEYADFVEILTEPGCCEICQDYKGVEFSVQAEIPMIPAHPNCRCTYVPIIK